MQRSFLSQALNTLWRHGLSSEDAMLVAVSILTLAHELPRTKTWPSENALRVMADLLKPEGPNDALHQAREWLRDPGLDDATVASAVNAILPLLPRPGEEADWDAEVAALFASAGRRGLGFMPSVIADALCDALTLPVEGRCSCAFVSAAPIAWSISRTRPVTLYAGENLLSLAILAQAAKRELHIVWRNPLDGTRMPTTGEFLTPDRSSPVEEADYIISAPPFGLRLHDPSVKGRLVEGLQIDRLAPLARKAFITLLPDGLLFREASADVELRRYLVEAYAITVMSLPTGVWGRAAGVLTSLLIARSHRDPEARVIDGRTMELQSVARVQDQLLAQHLEQWRDLVGESTNQGEIVTPARLEESYFVLLPDRYIRTDRQEALSSALLELQTVKLEDVASIERSKAPQSLRDVAATPELMAHEVSPSDIVDGVVQRPKRRVGFSGDERKRIEGVTIKPGDILVSIKGSVGVVGQVPLDAKLDELLDEPWIVSQSLAIIRWRPNSAILSASILGAILTAPWVREELERLSGGSVIKTLPMSAVRALQIPVPLPEDMGELVENLDTINAMRADIEARITNLRNRRMAVWSRLWNIYLEPGEQDDA